ncbi:MAG: PaaI family thioesterase [Hyphomonadaceae bacterium]|nr:PaaI family thioesterase [Hyphomonadaceae bacterium]MBP9235684.1 PaaI family thioesterase [Hyphomonadaceae bacterium]
MFSLDPKAEARCRNSFARQPMMTTIGASVLSVKSGEVEIEMPFAAHLTQQHGFLHAGVLATLTDTACGFAALTLMPDAAAVLATEFKINLLSPGKGDRFIARGRVARAGRKLMVCLGEAFAQSEGKRKQIALMSASVMVVDTSTGLKD